MKGNKTMVHQEPPYLGRLIFQKENNNYLGSLNRSLVKGRLATLGRGIDDLIPITVQDRRGLGNLLGVPTRLLSRVSQLVVGGENEKDLLGHF